MTIDIENLINGNSDDFRKDIQTALYDKVKDRLQDMKVEVAMTLYDDEIPEDQESR